LGFSLTNSAKEYVRRKQKKDEKDCPNQNYYENKPAIGCLPHKFSDANRKPRRRADALPELRRDARPADGFVASGGASGRQSGTTR
jgi:hypothetical protein